MLIADRLYHAEGRVGVNCFFLHETWSRSGEWYSNGGSDVSRCDRRRSKNSEATSTGADFSGEDFQNIETLIVLRSSVFAVSSAHKAQLARDAYNALWDSRPRNQERNCSPRSADQHHFVRLTSTIPPGLAVVRWLFLFGAAANSKGREECLPVEVIYDACFTG